VFAKGAKAEEAKARAPTWWVPRTSVEQVSKGTINFDRCIATPDMMGLVGGSARCWARAA
jgi:large subunit ribosomal protein L1